MAPCATRLMLRTLVSVCAVTAVTTATPRTFMSCSAWRSRAMPAPPLESEPPMTSTVGFTHATSISGREKSDVVMARGTEADRRTPGAQSSTTAKHDARVARYLIAKSLNAVGRESEAGWEGCHRRLLFAAKLHGDVARRNVGTGNEAKALALFPSRQE